MTQAAQVCKALSNAILVWDSLWEFKNLFENLTRAGDQETPSREKESKSPIFGQR